MNQSGGDVTVPACFISTHAGFLGSIKTFIKDFEVSEIDVNGVNVKSSSSSSSSVVFDSKPSSDSKGSVCSRDPGGPAAGPPSPESHSFGSDDALSPSVSAELERFAATLRGQRSAALQLSLGSFPDKQQRANVHRAVRQRFPFLMTVTSQQEIKVQEDPDYRELSRLTGDEDAEEFFRFIDAKVPGSSHTFEPDDDKEHRTEVHRFLNRRFGKLVETKSFSEEERTSISVRLREHGRPRKRTAQDREDVYTAFTLRKENLETLEAISHMASTLGVVPSDFTYAGIKDKRAVTHQSMVVKRVTPERLKEKSSEFEKWGMEVSHVRSVGEPLKLGRLRGNHFDLVVRNIKAHGTASVSHARLEGLVREAVENVKTKGFVNYYGPQRFGGSQTVQSDQVGLALLKEDMVGAVRLFFTPEDGDDPPNQAKRLFHQTNNPKEALALMPPSKPRERLMLRAMNRYGTGPDGCAQAWLSLPHGMRIFYPHAYCSRVWNEAVAHRLTTLGHSVKQGDLVWTEEKEIKDSGEATSPQIHVVTTQEEQSGTYTLEQVGMFLISALTTFVDFLAKFDASSPQLLLPMPGNTVTYPENAMATWYQERLARDGLTDCRFRVGSLKLNLPGCYRPLLAAPHNLQYELRRADDDGVQDRALALTLNFDLNPSCYATVCLREIMKADTLS
ncbi:Pseudouridylate synthase 7-like protein [Oryzias melastigma]|uniref:Pseudouridylate synthase PUS7L n=1 Tax=Oryzias melastigma TaxID=30732 RepID=A0A834FF65_ORYME|nr:Pseudouridylate synthase 7-like protein [Oryzias melastigma]